MNFPECVGATIRAYREKCHLSPTDLCKKLDISRPTITNWESGKTFPDANYIRKMCDLMDIPPLELLGITPDPRTLYSKDDARLLAFYHRLNDVNRNSLNRMINSMLADQEESRMTKLKEDYLVIFDDPTPAAAGTGCDYLDAEPEITFVKKNNVNLKADHLIHVSGQSMEPIYHDGDIVYVMRTQELVSGFDYICDTADGRVIKRAQNGRLYSLNRDLPYPEKFEDDHVTIFGRVLGIMDPDDRPDKKDIPDLQITHAETIRHYRKRMYQ